MIDRLRRIVAILLIPFVLVWSILMPRQAYAFAPAAVPAISFVAVASGAIIPIGIGVALTAAAYFAFKDLMTGDEVRIPASSAPSSVPPAPVAPSQAGAPVQKVFFSFDGVYKSENIETACTGIGGQYAAFNYRCWPPVGQSTWPGGVSYYNYGTQNENVCPAGYAVGASNLCELQNARAASNDGKQDYQRTGDAFAPYTGDLSGSLSATTMTYTSANDTVVVSGKDADGNAMQGKITALPTGGSQVELKTQKTNSAGQTYTETQTYRTNSAGDLVSAASVVTGSQLAYDPVTKVYTEVANPAGSAVPNASTGTAQSITFPSDYARQGEAASASNALRDALLQTAPAPADPAVPDPSGYTDFGSTFTSLLGWQLPGHASQCPTGSFTTPWGSSHVVDAHCQLVTNHWSALQAAMMVAWTVAALFIVLRA